MQLATAGAEQQNNLASQNEVLIAEVPVGRKANTKSNWKREKERKRKIEIDLKSKYNKKEAIIPFTNTIPY